MSAWRRSGPSDTVAEHPLTCAFPLSSESPPFNPVLCMPAKPIVFPPSARQAAGAPISAFHVVWGPVTRPNEGPDADVFLADGVFIAWVDRRLYGVHWRAPSGSGAWQEDAVAPDPGNCGLTQLWRWLTNLRLLSADQISTALERASGFLHAMEPTEATVGALLRHPDALVRMETQLNLPKQAPSAPRTARRASRKR